MSNRKRVTMKDVAAAIGVHQTTVSLAMRNHSSIPRKTRDFIHEKAREMGYVPDPMLSSLVAYRQMSQASKAPPTIGYIMDLKDEAHLEQIQARLLFCRSAKERAAELGFKLEVFFYGSGNYNSKSLDRILRTRRINGLIVAAFTHKTDLELSWDSFSVIKIEMLPFNLRFDVVESNQMQATRLAMEKMYEKGYRRVGMVIGKHDEVHTRNLFSAGFLVGQTMFEPEDRVPLNVIEGKNLDEELADIIDWLRTHRVETLITNWNELVPYMPRINKTLGREILFVSLDIDHFDPRAMGVMQNHEAVGRTAVDRLTGLMRNNECGMVDCPTIHLVDSLWHEPGKAPFEDPRIGRRAAASARA
ncbi:MAG: LacI family DNA-binding transcriptional regulator [Opitutales bacterium]|nr:LacI family DNA-binding transcriptional regulator [Opitutales bacterium]